MPNNMIPKEKHETTLLFLVYLCFRIIKSIT